MVVIYKLQFRSIYTSPSQKDILINFIINLPISKGYINIMVVIDQLSKIKHLIACPNILAPTIA